MDFEVFEEYFFLLAIAIILLTTKVLGLVFKKFQMPQVVGALLAGLILGPAVLGVLHETEFITMLSELGVVVLMFSAGVETDITELKRCGKSSFIIALTGVLVPLVGGFAVSHFMLTPESGDTDQTFLLKNIFIGVILTATSVSITVETLREMGKLKTKAGSAILGAAIIDDILGIIALTAISSLADTSVNIWIVLVKILGFFGFCALCIIVCYRGLKFYMARFKGDLRRFVILAFVICLVMAFCSEVFFGVADITGAYVAGLIISMTTKKVYIESRFSTLSYTLLSPIFFASIGLKVVLPDMGGSIILFAIVLTLVAILTKVIGCGLGARLCGFKNKESLQIGVGMVSRGEVALIVANKGASMGLMSQSLFGPIVIVVVVTTIIAPVLLKLAFSDRKSKSKEISKA